MVIIETFRICYVNLNVNAKAPKVRIVGVFQSLKRHSVIMVLDNFINRIYYIFTKILNRIYIKIYSPKMYR